jgi:hypothetical protein
MRLPSRKEIRANKTLRLFARLCKGLTPDEIYEVQDQHLRDEMRDEVYKIAKESDCEPWRCACIRIGYAFNVKSLINY